MSSTVNIISGSGAADGTALLNRIFDTFAVNYKTQNVFVQAKIKITPSGIGQLIITTPVSYKPVIGVTQPTTTESIPWVPPIINPLELWQVVINFEDTILFPSTWESHSLPGTASWAALVWNGVKFCLISSGAAAATSVDGITWDAQALPLRGGWYGLAWNGTVFCATGGNTTAETSPDGITWTDRTMASVGTNTNWGSIAAKGSLFCAVGYYSNNINHVQVSSDNGASWTLYSMPEAGDWHSVAASPSVFCAVAANGTKVATSPDGITWTARTLPVSADWRGIVWNGTTFCAVSDTSVALSVDGASWVAYTLPSGYWTSIAWNGTKFCVTGFGGEAAVSSDGITWEVETLPNTLFWGLVAGNTDKFCVVPFNNNINLTKSNTDTVVTVTQDEVDTFNSTNIYNGIVAYVTGTSSDPETLVIVVTPGITPPIPDPGTPVVSIEVTAITCINGVIEGLSRLTPNSLIGRAVYLNGTIYAGIVISNTATTVYLNNPFSYSPVTSVRFEVLQNYNPEPPGNAPPTKGWNSTLLVPSATFVLTETTKTFKLTEV